MFQIAVLSVLLVVSQAQYGVPPSYGPPQYNFPSLIDGYVCSIEGNYLLSDQHRKSRPVTKFCQDAHGTDACEKCCAMAARIGNTGVSEADIVGFKIVLKREPLCICCAPNRVSVTSPQATTAPAADSASTGY